MNDNPFVKPTSVQLVTPQVSSGNVGVVLLERVEPGVTPEYCIHGKTPCYHCSDWCWLGDQTHDVVLSGRAVPLCMQCATELLPKGSEPKERLHDHRRADGPH